MAVKSKTKQIHADVVAVKEKREKPDPDTLTNLPDSLQLRILSLLDAKYAVQTSTLSKPWVSLWKSTPVLQFHSCAFAKLRVYDTFVDRVLRHRDHTVKLESLTFTRGGICSTKMLNYVLGYAFSHGVKNLEAFIQCSRNKTWPIWCFQTCSGLLESLKLQSERVVSFPVYGLTFGSFKNLLDLYLKRVRILDPDLFSGFPGLKKLVLIGCVFDQTMVGRDAKICAPRLTDLTIKSYDEAIDSYRLTTPKLRFLEYRGSNFPAIETDGGGLPVLETAVIDFHGVFYQLREVGKFEELLSMFWAVGNVNSLTLFPAVVYFLWLFREELAEQESPFRSLNLLRIDLENLRSLGEYYKRGRWGLCSEVQGYLMKNSPCVELSFLNLTPRDSNSDHLV